MWLFALVVGSRTRIREVNTLPVSGFFRSDEISVQILVVHGRQDCVRSNTVFSFFLKSAGVTVCENPDYEVVLSASAEALLTLAFI